MSNKYKVILGGLLLSCGSAAMAGAPNSMMTVPQSIPAVSQAGLIALAFVLGIIGARLIKKIQKSKA